MKDIDHVPASGFGDLLVKSLAICAVVFVLLYFTVLDGHAQTIEASPPWSGSYIANEWQVPGKIATVPNRYLLMDGQNKVRGELVSKADAVAALYGPELIAALRSFMAATSGGTATPAALNTLRLTGGPLLTNIDSALK